MRIRRLGTAGAATAVAVLGLVLAVTPVQAAGGSLLDGSKMRPAHQPARTDGAITADGSTMRPAHQPLRTVGGAEMRPAHQGV